jgi:hypothetical protein
MNLGAADQTLSASASTGLNEIRFASSTPSVCTIFKVAVVAVAEGICTLTADVNADLKYAAPPQASVSFTIYPVGGPPTLPVVIHTVTYLLGGGSGTVPTHTDVAEGSGFTVAAGVGLTKTDYTFNKWNDGTADFSAGSIYTVASSNVVLTATWTISAAVVAKAAEDARIAALAAAAIEDARIAALAKAAEDARIAALAAAAIEDARIAALAKAAEDARIAAVAKAAEDARIAAEAKAIEDARIAALAKAAEDARIASAAAAAVEDARIAAAAAAAAKAVEDARIASAAAAAAAAAEDAAALATKNLVLKFSINMPVVKSYLDPKTKSLIKSNASTFPANTNITCIGYTYSIKPTKSEMIRAKSEALAACKYVATFKKGTKYYVLVKSWSAIKPKPKAMNTRKFHRLDISRSAPRAMQQFS